MTQLTFKIDETEYSIDIEKDLTIDSDQLDQEMKQTPAKFAMYSTLSAKLYAKKKQADAALDEAISVAKRQAELAKDHVSIVESERYLYWLENAEGKTTGAILDAYVNKDEQVIKARNNYTEVKDVDNVESVKKAKQGAIKAEELYKQVKAIADAFYMKASMLQSLGAMARSEMSLAGPLSVKDRLNELTAKEIMDQVNQKVQDI